MNDSILAFIGMVIALGFGLFQGWTEAKKKYGSHSTIKHAQKGKKSKQFDMIIYKNSGVKK